MCPGGGARTEREKVAIRAHTLKSAAVDAGQAARSIPCHLPVPIRTAQCWMGLSTASWVRVVSIEGMRGDTRRHGTDGQRSRDFARYATVAARWINYGYRGIAAVHPGDDARVTELTRVWAGLCEQLGLETATDPALRVWLWV